MLYGKFYEQHQSILSIIWLDFGSFPTCRGFSAKLSTRLLSSRSLFVGARLWSMPGPYHGGMDDDENIIIVLY